MTDFFLTSELLFYVARKKLALKSIYFRSLTETCSFSKILRHNRSATHETTYTFGFR